MLNLLTIIAFVLLIMGIIINTDIDIEKKNKYFSFSLKIEDKQKSNG